MKLFSLVLLFFLVGCAGTTTQTVASKKTTSVHISNTPAEQVEPASTPKLSVTENKPHITPYVKVIVTNVEVRYIEIHPVQIELILQGSLPDQCTYSFYSLENRNGQDVKLSLYGIHPADNNCKQTPQIIEYVLPLGRDLPEAKRGFPPGDYKLVVNNYQTGFSIK